MGIIVTLPVGKSNRGFSLLELMLVLVLLGVSTVMVLPSIDRGLKNREARHAALSFAATARELGSRARSEGLPQSLVIDAIHNRYVASRSQEISLPRNLTFAVVEGGEVLENGLRRFSFYPNGASFGGRVDFSTRANGVQYSVRIQPLTGQVEVLRGAAG
jgi:prepilin-type N-terminal cleavage/methylation domain-containing protein